MHYISLWWARGEDKTRTFVFCIKQSHLTFVCLRAALSNVMYMHVSQFRFRFSYQLCCQYSFIIGEEKMKENSILKRREHLACKKIKNKLEKKSLKNVNGAIFLIG